ncbi:hypothetical protein BJ878DRAFT_422890 [Calycina marina]|uniref:Uncharacterized protein n=1 Tax=Calycina marina TaxID=1763456 RepID=A0A9P7Z2L0_9HELO|nr:hypothetical protein BJ878DRAFT_422890 [Calycina marina]
MEGPIGYVVNGFSYLYIVAFVIFCFPTAMPTSPQTMNYSSLVTGGLTVFVTGSGFGDGVTMLVLNWWISRKGTSSLCMS